MSDLANLAEYLLAIPVIVTLTITNISGYREAKQDLQRMNPQSHKELIRKDGLICRASSFIGRQIAYSLY